MISRPINIETEAKNNGIDLEKVKACFAKQANFISCSSMLKAYHDGIKRLDKSRTRYQGDAEKLLAHVGLKPECPLEKDFLKKALAKLSEKIQKIEAIEALNIIEITKASLGLPNVSSAYLINEYHLLSRLNKKPNKKNVHIIKKLANNRKNKADRPINSSTILTDLREHNLKFTDVKDALNKLPEIINKVSIIESANEQALFSQFESALDSARKKDKVLNFILTYLLPSFNFANQARVATVFSVFTAELSHHVKPILPTWFSTLGIAYVFRWAGVSYILRNYRDILSPPQCTKFETYKTNDSFWAVANTSSSALGFAKMALVGTAKFIVGTISSAIFLAGMTFDMFHQAYRTYRDIKEHKKMVNDIDSAIKSNKHDNNTKNELQKCQYNLKKKIFSLDEKMWRDLAIASVGLVALGIILFVPGVKEATAIALGVIFAVPIVYACVKGIAACVKGAAKGILSFCHRVTEKLKPAAPVIENAAPQVGSNYHIDHKMAENLITIEQKDLPPKRKKGKFPANKTSTLGSNNMFLPKEQKSDAKVNIIKETKIKLDHYGASQGLGSPSPAMAMAKK